MSSRSSGSCGARIAVLEVGSLVLALARSVANSLDKQFEQRALIRHARAGLRVYRARGGRACDAHHPAQGGRMTAAVICSRQCSPLPTRRRGLGACLAVEVETSDMFAPAWPFEGPMVRRVRRVCQAADRFARSPMRRTRPRYTF